MNPERIEFLNHDIALCSDHLNDVVVIHFNNRCIHRETYPHNTERNMKLNEAKHVVWLRHLKAEREELKTFYENF